MADRILTWYIKGVVSEGTDVGERYFLDSDYEPVRVTVDVKSAPNVDTALIIDINDDDVSVFSDRPKLYKGVSRADEHTSFASATQFRKDSVITLDIDSARSGSDLIVHLELDKV